MPEAIAVTLVSPAGIAAFVMAPLHNRSIFQQRQTLAPGPRRQWQRRWLCSAARFVCPVGIVSLATPLPFHRFSTQDLCKSPATFGATLLETGPARWSGRSHCHPKPPPFRHPWQAREWYSPGGNGGRCALVKLVGVIALTVVVLSPRNRPFQAAVSKRGSIGPDC